MRRQRGAVAALLGLLLGVLLGGGAAAQEPGWSEPVSLGRYWFPDVAADAVGRAHIAWSSGADSYDTVMYSVWTPEDGLSQSVDVQAEPQTQGSEVSRPALYIAPDDTVHMSFRFLALQASSAPAADVLRPQAWTTPEQLASAGYFTEITADSTGVLHLLSNQNVVEETCQLCLHLFHQRSFDGGATWGEAQDISLLSSGTAKPQIVVDAADGLHVVYESGYGGTLGQLSGPTEVRYVSSPDGGDTWTAPIVLDAPLDEGMRPASRNIAIAIDRVGRLMVVWLDANRAAVYFRLSEDGGVTWSEPQPVGSIFSALPVYASALDIYSMVSDSAGDVHLVMVGRRTAEEPGLRLLHLVWNASTWSEPDTIAEYGGDAPEWPRIAVGNGNRLHVVWFVRNADALFQSDLGDYQVYYTTRLIDAPFVTPTPFRTSGEAEGAQGVAGAAGVPNNAGAQGDAVTPSPAAVESTPVPAIQPPTPLPPSSQATPGLMASFQDITSENDDVILVLAAALPAVLLILLLVLIHRIRINRRPR